MATLQELETEIQKIKERNERVEKDKAWEVSWERKTIIAVLTYIVIAIFFLFAGVNNPFVNAIVPSLAFILSTASLSVFKNIWLKYFIKK